MVDLFTFAGTLAMLVLLQAVLGFDNLLYISIESKRVEEAQQSYVRKLGIGLAIGLRIVLLVIVLMAIKHLQEPFFTFGIQEDAASHTSSETVEHADHQTQESHTEPTTTDEQEADKERKVVGHHPPIALSSSGKYFACQFNVHSVIVLLGGIFIIYTAFKEIFHMLAIEHIEHDQDGPKQRSVSSAVFWIVLMNLVFSFDSILSAIALTDNVWIMTLAIIISGLLMIFLADHVSEFLKKNRMYEVLGLFILLVVGVMLVSEGGHLAHLHFCGYEIVPMTKSTFYFVIGIMVFVDIVQTRYQKKLMAQRKAEMGHSA